MTKLSNPNPDAQFCPTLQPHVCSLPDSIVHGVFPGENTGVGCPFLFQGIFLVQGWNPHLLCLLHWESDSLPLHYLSKLCCAVLTWTAAHQAPLSMGILQARIQEWVAMPSSRGSSWPRNWTQVSRIAGGFFTIWTLAQLGYSQISVT